MLLKIPNIWKKISKKSCWNFHFLEKIQWEHIGLNTAKNTDFLKKSQKYFVGKRNLNNIYTNIGNWNLNNFYLNLFFHIIGITSSIEPESQSIFHFPYIIILWTCQSFEPLAQLREEIDICAQWLFCGKF